MNNWRVGGKVPVNVYDGDRPVCQCHNAEDAARIVTSINTLTAAESREAAAKDERDESREEIVSLAQEHANYMGEDFESSVQCLLSEIT